MGKNNNFKSESLAFAEKVKAVSSLDEERWFSSAYSTLNSRFTIEGGDLSREDRKTVKGILFSSIENLRSFSVGDYDKWFYELARGITDSYPKLSFGHSQKLINILMKYHFVYFCSDFNEEWTKKHSWLVPYFCYFHAPVDRKVLKNLTENYSLEIPPNKFSWTKWQWKEKFLYEEIQNYMQKIVEKNVKYCNNRLYFEMKELWKAPSSETTQKKTGHGQVVKMKKASGKDNLRNFLEETIIEINRQSDRTFELNDTNGYFSIILSGARRNKNVVCFVKDEHVLSINVNANIRNSFFANAPFNKLRGRSEPPRGLQLRYKDWNRYPYNLEYNLKEDEAIVFQLCKEACENFRV